ncbi:MAG: sigma-70 family RNA polymerase sigma factor [Dongiaceae bacterium]
MCAQRLDIAGTDEVRQSAVECIPHLRAFARSLCGNRDLADDLVQDAVVRALTCAGQYTPGTNFKAWIFTILRNLYFNELRRHRGRFTSIDDLGLREPSIGATQEAALEMCEFRRAFWQLSAEHREVLMLVGAGGLGYEEAATVCDCAVGTIKSRVSRARQTLKDSISNGELGYARNEAAPVAGADPLDTLASRPAVHRSTRAH